MALTFKWMGRLVIDARTDQQRRLRSRWAQAAVLAGIAAIGIAVAGPVSARTNCEVLAPGVDGVLRLDTGGALVWRCSHLRDDERAQIEDESASTRVHRRMQEEALRLKGETARLKVDMARLKDETSQLQMQTARLKDRLALRDAAVAAAETARGKTDSKIDSPRRDGAIATSALKGDLLGIRPQQTEIQKTPQEKKVEAKVAESAIDRPAAIAADGGADVHRADENVSEPKARTAERAWRRLIDFAARMKNNLSGSVPR